MGTQAPSFHVRETRPSGEDPDGGTTRRTVDPRLPTHYPCLDLLVVVRIIVPLYSCRCPRINDFCDRSDGELVVYRDTPSVDPGDTRDGDLTRIGVGPGRRGSLLWEATDPRGPPCTTPLCTQVFV